MIFDFIPTLAVTLSLIAISLVVSIITINIYLRIRKYIPATVNCWFCNTWTKVPYENRNSFECPSCLQYNGFTKDGSYNKVIEAQHNVPSNRKSSKPTYKRSNGLCDSCNRNQQLKITQLANFTPLVEKNYDVEVEHFRNQLEMAYQLCSQCSRVLKSTLLKEKALLFGRHVRNIQKTGQKLLQTGFEQETSTVVRIFKHTQGFLAVFIIVNVFIQTTVDNQALPQYLPSFLLPFYELYQELVVFFLNVVNEMFLEYLTFRVNYSTLLLFSMFGLILQIMLFLMKSSIVLVKVNQLLCWSFLSLTSWTTNGEGLLCTYVFQIFCSLLICYNNFLGLDMDQKEKATFKKISKNREMELFENSDDDLDTSTHSTKSAHSKDSTYTLRKRREFNNLNNSIRRNDTASKVTSWTANNLNNTNLYSNIRTSLEDLHLDNSTFNLRKAYSVSRESSPMSERRHILSPSKFAHNSWVAGGFWKNQNDTIIPTNNEASISPDSSQSSGFCSRIKEPLANFNNPFYSLPPSRNTSFCDRHSLVSEPPYRFRSTSPQSIWTSNSFNYRSPSSTSQFNSSFRDFREMPTSNNKFNELIVPSNNGAEYPQFVCNGNASFNAIKKASNIGSCVSEPINGNQSFYSM